MSLTEVDPFTWRSLWHRAFKGYLSQGMKPAEARRATTQAMRMAFAISTEAAANEAQKDHDDERNADWTR